MRQKHKNKDEEAYERRYWLWVTRPEYYLNKQGYDREDLGLVDLSPRYTKRRLGVPLPFKVKAGHWVLNTDGK